MRRPLTTLRARAAATCVGLAAMTLVFAGCASGSGAAARTTAPKLLGPGDHVVTVVSGGRTRSMIVHVPPGPRLVSRALVLVYHGAFDTAQWTEQNTDLATAGDHARNVVVFLQGYRNTWNSGVGHTYASDAGVDDVAFTKAAIAKLEAVVGFDHQRIAAVGFSNGALLTEMLGCRLAGTLALIAPVEGELPVQTSNGCKPSRSIAVYEIHATGDTVIPYSGGWFHSPFGDQVDVLSAPSSVKRWAALDACAKSPATRYPNSTEMLTTYRGCKRSVKVTLHTDYGGSHEWATDTGALVMPVIPK